MTVRSQHLRSASGAIARPHATGAVPDAGAAAPLTGIGDDLRSAREALGLSYAEAERDTHIPRHHLLALEEERFDAFAALVYVRGFLRSYGQYLGLDSSALVNALPRPRPVEEEGLLPLSRLGRPRGPREAARARRDPFARDAAPLTEPPLRRPAQRLQPLTSDDHGTRSGFEPTPDEPARPARRLDPLGRLGWPERPGGSPAPPPPEEFDPPAVVAPALPVQPMVEAPEEPEAEAQTYVPPRRVAAGSGRPHRPISTHIHMALPADVRPLFSRVVLSSLAGVGALLLLLAFVARLAGGGDLNPAVLAASARAVAAPTPITLTESPAVSRGRMPALHGRDLGSALLLLRNAGIVPIVIQQPSTTTPSGQVVAQAPAAGHSVDSNTPVMVVVSQGH